MISNEVFQQLSVGDILKTPAGSLRRVERVTKSQKTGLTTMLSFERMRPGLIGNYRQMGGHHWKRINHSSPVPYLRSDIATYSVHSTQPKEVLTS